MQELDTSTLLAKLAKKISLALPFSNKTEKNLDKAKVRSIK